MTEPVQAHGSFSLVGRKIMLGLPAYDFKVSVKLAISLAQFCVEAPKHGVQIQICNISGCSVVSRVRNLIAKDFLASDCTDLMFIDSDINFQAEDIFRLMAWNTDPKKGIVGGVPVARKKQKTYISTLEQDADGGIYMNAYGLVKAKRIATAFMLIRREVFETLRDNHPEWKYHDDRVENGHPDKFCYSFFDFKSTPEGYVGEDYTFCDRATEHGFEVWIDPTIKLNHMGITEFEGSFGEDYLYPMLRPVDAKKGRCIMAKTPAWQRKEGKNPSGGLNAKGRASYNAANPGKPGLKRPQPEGGSRRDSFCARMKGMKKKLTSAKTANDPNSRINKSLRAWNCKEGGSVRGGGCEVRGKTKGKMV